jgi:hypothetical protein
MWIRIRDTGFLCLNEWVTSKRGPVVIGQQIFVEPFSVRIGLCPAAQAQQRCQVN